MLIFGFGPSAPKVKGAAVATRCPNCANPVDLQYAVIRSWFRLFFVPVVPYRTRHVLLCPTCSRGFELTATQGRVAADLAAGRPDGARPDGPRAAALAEELGLRPADAAGPLPTGPPPPGPPPPGPTPTGPPPPERPVQAAPPTAPAGWYPDPYGEATQRYWDGQRWTGGTIPPTA